MEKEGLVCCTTLLQDHFEDTCFNQLQLDLSNALYLARNYQTPERHVATRTCQPSLHS